MSGQIKWYGCFANELDEHFVHCIDHKDDKLWNHNEIGEKCDKYITKLQNIKGAKFCVWIDSFYSLVKWNKKFLFNSSH